MRHLLTLAGIIFLILPYSSANKEYKKIANQNYKENIDVYDIDTSRDHEGDTFSIIGYDPVTGEIGGAGCSCYSGHINFLNDIVRDGSGNLLGAIHTQAAYNGTNQTRARNRMLAGDTPQQIINYVNSLDGNPASRQYGIVGIDGTGTIRTAAYTGTTNGNYANHIIGPTYTIHGNILDTSNGQDLLNDMEEAYLNTSGTLADKLMAAMQAAKRVGGDNRCTNSGQSGRAAFVRVLRPSDPINSPYVDISVYPNINYVEPIDVLQCNYDTAVSTPFCRETVNTFPYIMDFEVKPWETELTCANRNSWIRTRHATPTANTGPASASQGTLYTFVESSDLGHGFNRRAVIGSPCFELPENLNSTMTFDYHMYGSSMGTLNVTANNGTGWTTIWSLSGNQGNIWNTASIDLTPFAGSTLKLRFDATTGSSFYSDMAIDNINIFTTAPPITEYIYMNGIWSPGNPEGVSTLNDNITVVNGSTVLSGETNANHIIIENEATLNVPYVLRINGNIQNNGNLVFVSNNTTTGQLDTFTGNITGSGQVTIERYIPARRAFRFLSSAITSSGSINANWQEGSINATDNPNPGFGTHITGSSTGQNGFDATPSGNPSMFTLDNIIQQWIAIPNTDVNTIEAGTAYRILVRGDRSIDLTSNSSAPTNTSLRTTGTLHTGPYTFSDLSQAAGQFNFIGNPYPAAVDMNEVIAASSNVNAAYYYIWDPTLGGEPVPGQQGGRGAYVVIDLSNGSNSSGSDGNQYLQPGQAAFVTTLANGPASLHFEETHKSVAQSLTTVFNVESRIDIRLYRADAFATGSTASDGLRFKFGENHTNTITSMDALKFFNQDENLASSNDGRLWSIECRALPLAGESIPLFTNQYRTTNYVFEVNLTEIDNISAILVDKFMGTTTQLMNNENTIYAFTINPDNPESIASNRFEIIFEELLSINDVTFGDGFVLFPNPVDDRLTITAKGISGNDVRVNIMNMMGQMVSTGTHRVNSNGNLTIDASALAQGIYFINLTHTNDKQFTAKFIKK